MFSLNGSIVALVTPMQEDGALDRDALDRLVDWHAEQGTAGIVAVGTTGESATLDVEEHCAVIEHIVQRAAGRLPVIAGTGANATREAISLSQRAADLGADACLLVTPYYNKPGQEGLYQHYRAVARAVDIPQILYNVPARTACDLLPETVQRLAELPQIAGIKEATGALERALEIRRLCGDEFPLYSGDDPSAAQLMLQAGARGVVSVSANVIPAAMAQMCAAALAGESEPAQALDARLQPLHKMLFVEANPIPVKWALHRMGRIGPGIRLPLTPLAAEHHEALHQALQQGGALD